MKKLLILAVASIAFVATSCTQYGYMATGGTGTKTGEASKKLFLGINLGHVDVGIATAAKKGGITKVATVDYTVKRGLFVTTYKTVVTGE